MITLYNGDCLLEFNKISDNTIDLILADLPYGTTDRSGLEIRSTKKIDYMNGIV